MKAVVFGAGNIGRGFLGALLAQSGYSITFVDVDQQKIKQINEFGEYPVITVDKRVQTDYLVRGVKAVHITDAEAVASAIADTCLVLTAVGKQALQAIGPLIAQGLRERMQRRNDSLHLVVVACENVTDNTALLKSYIMGALGEDDQKIVSSATSFPNCVVDCIVPSIPAITHIHPLAVAVENYRQFVVDESQLQQPMSAVAGVDFSHDLSAVLEQKLFTLNMAHAIVAYYGYLRGCAFIHDAVSDRDINALATGALAEVSVMLTRRHPSLFNGQLRYAERVLQRFANPFLQDAIARVARDPVRKLSAADRLVRPAQLVMESGHLPAYLATGIAGALRYDFTGDEQASSLTRRIRDEGIDRVLTTVSNLAPESDLARLVRSDFLFRGL